MLAATLAVCRDLVRASGAAAEHLHDGAGPPVGRRGPLLLSGGIQDVWWAWDPVSRLGPVEQGAAILPQ